MASVIVIAVPVFSLGHYQISIAVRDVASGALLYGRDTREVRLRDPTGRRRGLPGSH